MIGLNKQETEKLKEALNSAVRPLIFFHDDADGLSSFLLLYRYIRDGKGIVIKSTPNITVDYLRKVKEYDPDKIFIVDIAMVEQEFIDKAKKEIIWVDHHGPYERHNVVYLNPKKRGESFNAPASYLCYQAVEEDLWIAMAGIIGDWFLTPLAKTFSRQYPDLLPKDIKSPPEALFNSKIG